MKVSHIVEKKPQVVDIATDERYPIQIWFDTSDLIVFLSLENAQELHARLGEGLRSVEHDRTFAP